MAGRKDTIDRSITGIPWRKHSRWSDLARVFSLSLSLVAAVSGSVQAAEVDPELVRAGEASAPAGGCTQLQALVDQAAPGTTVIVPGCVYRETVSINKPLTLAGQAGAEIRGSDVWPAWNQQAGTWLSQQAVPTLPTVAVDPTACQADTNNRCLWPEQVFLDGRALEPVAPGAVPGSGQFALVSNADRRLRLADNPSGHTIEVATRPRWIVTNADGVTIQGLTMRHAGNSTVSGAISNDGFSNWVLLDSTVSDAHSADVSLDGGRDLRVEHNDVSSAGLVGVSGADVNSGGIVRNNRIHDNHISHFNRNWGAGGLKLTRVQDFVVDANEADHNDGVGLWCDLGCTNATFSDNRVHHNQWQGINFEISNGAAIYNNAAWENGWGKPYWGWGAGIVISSSANADVHNNTVAWNYAGISAIAQIRPESPGLMPTGNYLHDNVILKRVVRGDFSQTYWFNLSLAWLQDGVPALYDGGSNNRSQNNQVWYDVPEDVSVRFSWADQYLKLAEFANTSGGIGTRYLTTAAKEQVLNDALIPLRQEN